MRHKDLDIEVLPEGYRVRGARLMPRPTARQALLAFCESPHTSDLFKIGYGPIRYRLVFKQGKREQMWILLYESPIHDSPRALYSWPFHPGRRELARIIRAHYRANPFLPSVYGWRKWYFDTKTYVLKSPVMHTPWPTAALQAHTWSNEPLVHGYDGVHARRCPADWRSNEECWPEWAILVTGIVERYGRAVLGRNGWRSEHAVIRELIARDYKIALALSMRYTSVRVWCVDPRTNTLKEVSNGN
jgi:hypothetical protein